MEFVLLSLFLSINLEIYLVIQSSVTYNLSHLSKQLNNHVLCKINNSGDISLEVSFLSDK